MLLICTNHVEAHAVAFEVNTDADVIRAGEQVSVTIKLDKTIPEGDEITTVQGELYYNPSVLTYVSHEMEKDYKHFMSMNREEKERFV